MPGLMRCFTGKAGKRREGQLNEKITAATNGGSKPAANGVAKPTVNGATKPIVHENAETVEDLISRIKTLAAKSDAVECTKIQDRLREARYSLETPYETLLRLSAGHLEIAAARLGADLSIFKILVESDVPLTTSELAKQTSAQPELLGRLLRYFASISMIRECGKDEFTANAITKTLADPGYEAGIYHAFDNTGPIFQALPDFLAETKYEDIPDGAHTVFQKAFGTELSCFGWLSTHPKRFGYLQKLMTVTRQGDWLSVFPAEKEVGSWTAGENGTLFVDVGGSMGHQCVKFHKQHPKIAGRFVLQDLPQVIQRVPPQDGIEAMVHDFFKPQPVKGAKFYYLRQILHDYEDEKCVAILKSLLPALEPHSRVLIDDVVIPPTGAHWQEAAMDLAMMAALGSKERTRDQFEKIFDAAGYRIEGVYPYSWPVENTVLVTLPK